MTKSKTTFTRAFSGFLIILALMAIFSLIGGSSASSQSGDNGEKLVTIEAGTYVFDDLVPHYRWPEENIPLFFTCSWVDPSGTLVYTEANSIIFYRDVIMGEHVWNIMDYGFTTYMYGDESQLDKGWVSVHKCVSRPGLNVCEEEWGDEGYKIITIPYDQKVTEAAGKWTDIYLTRVENTEGDVGNTDNEGSFGETPTYKENVIYAGTYRFNDTITVPECYSINNVNWYIPYYYVTDCSGESVETAVLNYKRVDEPAYFTDMYWPQDPDTGLHFAVTTLIDGESNVGRIVYTSEYGWNEAYEQLLSWRKFFIDIGAILEENAGYPDFMKGWGQVFVVPEDTEINDETAFAWFTENTTALIEADTYKWNDILTEYYASQFIDIPVSIQSYDLVNGNIIEAVVNFDTISLHRADVAFPNEPFRLDYNYYGGSTLQNQIHGYSTNSKWNFMHDWYLKLFTQANMEIPPELALMKGVGQIFTVTEDTFVSTEFYDWFITNAGRKVSIASETTSTVFNIDFDEVCVVRTNKHDLMCA